MNEIFFESYLSYKFCSISIIKFKYNVRKVSPYKFRVTNFKAAFHLSNKKNFLRVRIALIFFLRFQTS